MQQQSESLPFLADAVLFGNPQAVDEQGVGVDAAAAHLLDLAYFHAVAVEAGVEQGEAVGRAPALLARRGAGEQQDPVGDLGGGGPHLAPVDDVAPAVAAGEGGDAAGIESGVGLGHPEAADLLSGDEGREEARLLLLGAGDHDRHRSEDVEVNPGGRAHRAGGVRDRMHHHRRLGHPEAAPAVLGRHGDAEPAALGHGTAKLVRKCAVAVPGEPVVVAEAGGDAADALVDRTLVVGQSEVHGGVRGVRGAGAGGGEVGRLEVLDRAVRSSTVESSETMPRRGDPGIIATTCRHRQSGAMRFPVEGTVPGASLRPHARLEERGIHHQLVLLPFEPAGLAARRDIVEPLRIRPHCGTLGLAIGRVLVDPDVDILVRVAGLAGAVEQGLPEMAGLRSQALFGVERQVLGDGAGRQV